MSPEERERIMEITRSHLTSLPYYITDYIKHRKDMSANTMYNYAIDFDGYLTWIEEKTPYATKENISILYLSELTKEYIDDFIKHCIESNNSADTIARKIASLKSLFRYLCTLKEEDQYILYENVMADVPIIKKEIEHKKRVRELANLVLTEDQIDIFLEFIRNQYQDILIEKNTTPRKYKSFIFNKERDLAFLRILFNTGLRISEALSVDVTSVDFGQMELEFMKNGDSLAKTKFDDKVAAELNNYLGIREERYSIDKNTKSLFVSRNTGNSGKSSRVTVRAMQNRINEYAASFGLTSFKCDNIRHIFAVNHYHKYEDLEELKKIMRHANIARTRFYADVAKFKYKKG